jgi:signal transduction histidine kinase
MIAAVGLISARLLSALGSLAAAQAGLRDNMERLRRSDATKDKLFSVIAHDLRGPMGGIANLLETLSTDNGEMGAAQVAEFIEALRTASWNTYQLLENLLAWSRSQRGEMAFRPERLPVLPLVEECGAIFELSAKEKGIIVETSIEVGVEARADPERLKILLRNLISNAVKFTARGGRVSISASRAEGGTLLGVRDEGIGMDGARIAALFDLGSAPSRAGTANERGSGLGLALCKEIADLHGGTIEVFSEPGKGSAFSVFLPD